MQISLQKLRYFGEKICQIRFALVQHNKIVSIADVIVNLQGSFDKLVKFVHIDIDKKLTG